MVMITGRCENVVRVAKPMLVMTYPPPNILHHYTTLIAPQNHTPPFTWSLYDWDTLPITPQVIRFDTAITSRDPAQSI